MVKKALTVNDHASFLSIFTASVFLLMYLNKARSYANQKT